MGRTCGEPDEIGLAAMGVKLNGSRCRSQCGNEDGIRMTMYYYNQVGVTPASYDFSNSGHFPYVHASEQHPAIIIVCFVW